MMMKEMVVTKMRSEKIMTMMMIMMFMMMVMAMAMAMMMRMFLVMVMHGDDGVDGCHHQRYLADTIIITAKNHQQHHLLPPNL